MVTPPKPEAKPPETPPAAPAAKPGEPPKQPDKAAAPAAPGEKVVAESKGMREVREALKRKEAAAAELEKKVSDFQQKISEYESKGKDTAALTERLATLEKQLDDANKRIYAMNVGESPEFKKEYVKPYQDAWEYATTVIQGVEVATERDPDTGQAVAFRKADWNKDFLPVLEASKQSLTRARQVAQATFGDDAPLIMDQVQELGRRERLYHIKLRELQDNAKTESEKQIATRKAQEEWERQAWERINHDISEKNPDVFQPDPKDKQRAEIWNKSISLVDSIHNSNALTPVQRLALTANIRHRAAAFPVLQYDNNRLKERVSELETQIAEMKGSLPGTTQRPGGDSTNPPAEKSFLEELESLEA